MLKAKFSRFFSLLILIGVSYSNPGFAVSLSIEPGASAVNVGSPLTVQLIIADLISTAAPSLGAYDLTINYESAILSLESVAFGDPSQGNQLELQGFESLQDLDISTTDTINLSELSFDDQDILNTQQAGNFTLAVLNFQALTHGTSPLNFTSTILSDASGEPINATTNAASVTVVPLPASIWLLATALAAMFGRRGIIAFQKKTLASSDNT